MSRRRRIIISGEGLGEPVVQDFTGEWPELGSGQVSCVSDIEEPDPAASYDGKNDELITEAATNFVTG